VKRRSNGEVNPVDAAEARTSITQVEPDAPSELDLRSYLRILRRRKWSVILATLVAVAIAVGASLIQDPVYEGDARVLLETPPAETLFNPVTGQRTDPKRRVETEIEVVESAHVRRLVSERVGPSPRANAVPVRQTDVIAIRVRSIDADRAAVLANAYAAAYIDFRRSTAVASLVAAGTEIQRHLTEQRTQTDRLDQQIAAAEAANQVQRASDLRAERNAALEQQGLLRQKLDQLQVESSLHNGGAQVVSPARALNRPVSPQPIRDGALAALFGVLLGVGVAILREQLDDTIKAKEDLERATPGVPVLALVPVIDSTKERGLRAVVSIGSPGSSAAEAYRTLRTSIQFMGLDRPLRTLQVTSAAAKEGKTTTIVNLAIALARAGQRVVLVDCDLRQPRIHDELDLNGEVGFTSVLVGSVGLDEALQSIPGEDLLAVLTAGPKPPNPSELLSGRRAADVFNALEARSDIVLIDSPPVLPVTDAVVIAGRVDATLLVAMAGKTTRHSLSRAREVLANIEGPVVGVVLNAIAAEDSYGYGYRYGYHYTRSAEPAPPNGKGEANRARREAV
jgi:capsular exopolysaccharide synthesis family protein